MNDVCEVMCGGCAVTTTCYSELSLLSLPVLLLGLCSSEEHAIRPSGNPKGEAWFVPQRQL